MAIVSTKITNAIATNVSINCHSKKVRYCYNLHTVLLVIILILLITITCYHYVKHWPKQEIIDELAISKWKIMNFKKFILKIVRVIISMI